MRRIKNFMQKVRSQAPSPEGDGPGQPDERRRGSAPGDIGYNDMVGGKVLHTSLYFQRMPEYSVCACSQIIDSPAQIGYNYKGFQI